MDAGAEPEAADGLGEGEVEVEAATMAALVDENTAQANVFEVLLDKREPLGGLAGVVGGVFVDVDDEPPGFRAGAGADDAAGVLVQLFLLDGAKGELGDGFPLGSVAWGWGGGVDPVPAVGEEVGQVLAGFTQGQGVEVGAALVVLVTLAGAIIGGSAGGHD